MIKLLIPGIVATCVALFVFARRRKVEGELTDEEVDEIAISSGAALDDTAVLPE